MTNESVPPRKRGCFFYGCIALIIAVLIASVGAVLLFRYAQRAIHSAVNEYTDAQPVPLENADTSPAKVKAVQDKIAAFKQASETQQTSQELVLTADEINTLIASDPNQQQLANHLHIMIEDDQVKTKISWPLEDIGPLKLKGRYLNGVATLNVSMDKGKLHARAQDVTAKDKPLPSTLLEQMKTIDFGANFQQNPEGAAAVSHIESIRVKDGQVIIRSKPGR